MLESPYRVGEHLYRMYKQLPPRYAGDPFDLFRISCWLFENLYGFRIVSSDEPHVDFVSDFRFASQTLAGAYDTQIEGHAYVVDSPGPITLEKATAIHKENKKHLLAIIARDFTPEAEKFCQRHRILGISATTIATQFRTVFTVDLLSFAKEHIHGTMIPLNSKYADQLTELSPAPTFFKRGPTGKYLKEGDLVLFFVEESPYFPSGGIHAYGEVATCEIDTPQKIWNRYSGKAPMFPEDEYFAWSADKTEVIALTLSRLVRIKPMRWGKLTTAPFVADRIGHFYLSREEIDRFLKNVKREEPLTNLDKSQSPRVFLSSTITDLRGDREYAIRVLKDDLNYNVFASRGPALDYLHVPQSWRNWTDHTFTCAWSAKGTGLKLRWMARTSHQRTTSSSTPVSLVSLYWYT